MNIQKIFKNAAYTMLMALPLLGGCSFEPETTPAEREARAEKYKQEWLEEEYAEGMLQRILDSQTYFLVTTAPRPANIKSLEEDVNINGKAMHFEVVMSGQSCLPKRTRGKLIISSTGEDNQKVVHNVRNISISESHCP